MINEKTRHFAASSIFPSFFLAAYGLVMAQAAAARMNGSWLHHALIGIPGIGLSGLALYRARLHWLAGSAAVPGQERGRRQALNPRDIGWWTLLFATGIVVGFSSRSVLLLGSIASLMYLVPWSRIPLCRSRFIASAIITLAGAIPWPVLYGIPIPALYYLAAAWMVSIPPVLMMFMVLVSLPYGYRVHESAQGGDPGEATRQPLRR